MYFVRRGPDIKSLNAVIRLCSSAKRSHYDVLNVRRNCTDKEIKEAFIQLSKEYHPDKNKDAKAQEQFIRIVEAYNVLSKPSARAQYDMSEVYYNGSNTSSQYVYRSYTPHNLRKNPQYSYYYDNYGQKESYEKARARYNANTMKKMPNYIVIVFCCGVAFIGMFMQIVIIGEIYGSSRRKALERSQRLAEELDKVRAAAHGNTNEMQTRALLEKIVTAANPTVATASLGQALANEKK